MIHVPRHTYEMKVTIYIFILKIAMLKCIIF